MLNPSVSLSIRHSMGQTGQCSGRVRFRFGLLREWARRLIAVDDAGFIYVADVGNRRIQKFAP